MRTIQMKNRTWFAAMVCLAAPLLASGQGDIYYTKPVKAVLFSHKAHTENIGLQCEWCHEKTFDVEALKVQGQPDFNMESLCNEKYCGVCHNGDVAFSTTTQCARCHIGKKVYNQLVRLGKVKPAERSVPAPKGASVAREPKLVWHEHPAQPAATGPETKALEQMIKEGYYPGAISFTPKGVSPVVFSHKTHLEREHLRCTECHPGVFNMNIVKNFGEKTGPAYTMMVEKGKYCGACHNGEKAFSLSDRANCARCHRAPSAAHP
jgi:c(7)-type cytochrome triheme protein